MLSVGLDLHKRYSQVDAVDESGASRATARLLLLLTVPGLGQLLATVVALEIDRIDRFRRSSKLVAYAGLVPSTYSSGGKTSHGGPMKMSNKWLRWALVPTNVLAPSVHAKSLTTRFQRRSGISPFPSYSQSRLRNQ